ncbi:MAG: phospho-N-acetylmuramoyl-pentapeptide-transferase [Anaerolineae bacterium]|nr:phospho-N-acetylmuramoyl-pentapeptide-transferase [Anaerolineae bacterium]
MTQSSVVLALAGISFLLTVIWGGPLVRILRQLEIGDSIRVEAPERHATKIGTPTMGGVMFILPVLMITILINAVSLIGLSGTGRSILVPLGTMVLFALLGSVDDWEKLRNKAKGEGMSARTKFGLQVVLSGVIAFGLHSVLKVPHLFFPGVQYEIGLGWVYVPLAMFIIVASANAVNFTDGLDGLAGLISATAVAAYGGIALLQGQIFLAQFCFTLVGALFGFLWFNVHPAMLIMGDTGSMALGATLGVAALMTGHWILLPIIAIIPVSEVVSVILQVGYFKLTKGRRIFKMAPFHLHFELSGWSESQIVQRFWLIGLLFAMIGVALAVV